MDVQAWGSRGESLIPLVGGVRTGDSAATCERYGYKYPGTARTARGTQGKQSCAKPYGLTSRLTS